MVVAATDWTNVLVALIAGLPAIIAAVAAILIRRDIATPSGEKIGVVAEQAHHATAANTGLLVALNDGVRAAPGMQPVEPPPEP